MMLNGHLLTKSQLESKYSTIVPDSNATRCPHMFKMLPLANPIDTFGKLLKSGIPKFKGLFTFLQIKKCKKLELTVLFQNSWQRL